MYITTKSYMDTRPPFAIPTDPRRVDKGETPLCRTRTQTNPGAGPLWPGTDGVGGSCRVSVANADANRPKRKVSVHAQHIARLRARLVGCVSIVARVVGSGLLKAMASSSWNDSERTHVSQNKLATNL